MAINFFSEKIKFNLKGKNVIKKWLRDVSLNETKQIGEINFVFSTDDYLLKINKKYLNHNYFTDIITFNYNESGYINGDIYISVERVLVNAKEYKTTVANELHRVIVHGILHLIGYDDTSEVLKSIMTEKEDYYLKLLSTKYLLKG